MKNSLLNVNAPNNSDRLLRYIRRFCEPETCAAIQFSQFAQELGDLNAAEKALKDLWNRGLVSPTRTEIDPEDGALFEVSVPRIEDPIKDASQFILTNAGYKAIEPFFDPYLDVEPHLKSEELPVPQTIVVATEFINAKLMEELEKNPERMLSLTPRQFEELVAELFYREGFDVELTPEKRDGGRDILAVNYNELGSHLYLAECKKYEPSHPVGVEYVRSLYGVVEAEKATRGIIASTSYFTKGAKDFSRDLKWRVGLINYDDLRDWVKKCTFV